MRSLTPEQAKLSIELLEVAGSMTHDIIDLIHEALEDTPYLLEAKTDLIAAYDNLLDQAEPFLGIYQYVEMIEKEHPRDFDM